MVNLGFVFIMSVLNSEFPEEYFVYSCMQRSNYMRSEGVHVNTHSSLCKPHTLTPFALVRLPDGDTQTDKAHLSNDVALEDVLSGLSP